MADFTKTITNTLNVFGASPPTKWGIGIWGVMLWGVTQDFEINVIKVLGEAISFSSSVEKVFIKELSNSVSFATDLTTFLTLDDIWNYLFAKSTTDGALQVVDQFTRVSDPSTTQTETSLPTTTWTSV